MPDFKSFLCAPLFLMADYPYCLVNKELRSIIKSLLSKSVAVLDLFFDHCIYTMLQELDKTSGESQRQLGKQVFGLKILPGGLL